MYVLHKSTLSFSMCLVTVGERSFLLAKSISLKLTVVFHITSFFNVINPVHSWPASCFNTTTVQVHVLVLGLSDKTSLRFSLKTFLDQTWSVCSICSVV